MFAKTVNVVVSIMLTINSLDMELKVLPNVLILRNMIAFVVPWFQWNPVMDIVVVKESERREVV